MRSCISETLVARPLTSPTRADVQVERRWFEEADRAPHYLSSVTQEPLQALVIQNLITDHMRDILEMPGSGLSSMIDGGKIAELRGLYNLFSRVPDGEGRNSLRIALRMDIEERGKAVNEASASVTAEPEIGQDDDPKGKGKAKASPAQTALASALRWVQDVLDLKDNFDRTLQDAFLGDLLMQAAINEAFQSFINAHPRSSEFLSLFIDDNLKKGARYVSLRELGHKGKVLMIENRRRD